MSLGGVGQGVVLGLSVDTIIGRVRSLQMPEWLVEAVDFSGLEDLTWMKFLPGGLGDPGAFIADIYFDSTMVIPTLKVIQVATITFPIQVAGNSTKGTLTGSGFVNGIGWPNAAIADPLMRQLTFKYDGNSQVPAYSVEDT